MNPKVAWQIYGTFRSFTKCLPEFHKICDFDADVYFLSEKREGYSSDNEKWIKSFFGEDNVVYFGYVDDWNHSEKEHENKLFSDFFSLPLQYYKNHFVRRLFYRRWKLNEIRKSCGKKYDWIIRTRPDIIFANRFHFPKENRDVMSIWIEPDVLSIGSEKSIDIESSLGLCYPVFQDEAVWTSFWENIEEGKYNFVDGGMDHLKMICTEKDMKHKWFYSAELNLVSWDLMNGIFLKKPALYPTIVR